MSIQYAGGVNVNTQVSAATKTLITNNVKAQLVIAGWTVAAGAPGDWKLDSAITPAGHQCRVRIKDGVANCELTLSNVAETLSPAQVIWLWPLALKQFRVLANKYQFVVFEQGAMGYRDFAFCTTPWTPPFIVVANNSYLAGNGQSAADVTTRNTFRNGQAIHSTAMAWLWDAGFFSQAAGTASAGCFRYQHLHDPLNTANNFHRWADDSLDAYDAVVGHGGLNATLEGKKIGLMWDAFICSGDFIDGTFITYDGKQFLNVGASIIGTSRGTLFVYAP